MVFSLGPSNYSLLTVFPIGPSKIFGRPKIRKFTTPRVPAHSHASEPLTPHAQHPAQHRRQASPPSTATRRHHVSQAGTAARARLTPPTAIRSGSTSPGQPSMPSAVARSGSASLSRPTMPPPGLAQLVHLDVGSPTPLPQADATPMPLPRLPSFDGTLMPLRAACPTSCPPR
jgi:hypothetical protein